MGVFVEVDMALPVGPPPDLQGTITFREYAHYSEFGEDLPTASITTLFLDYSMPASEAPPRQVNGECELRSRDERNNPGRSSPVDAGDISVVGGPQPVTLEYDAVASEYLADGSYDDLWAPGDVLAFTGAGSGEVGRFSYTIASPTDVVVESPDELGAFDRAGTTVEWAMGNGDVIEIEVAPTQNLDYIICTTEDDGRFDMAAGVMNWLPAGTRNVRFSLTRVRDHAFDSDAPVARSTISLERVRSFQSLPLE